jgi:hypothetical protein
MVLNPINSEVPPPAPPVPAWYAIHERQKQRAGGYWLVSQPDHARLSGDLAASFVSERFPRICPKLANSIGMHDAGWAVFAAEADPAAPPHLTPEGKPVAFVESEPRDFLRAWTASIARAEGICPEGGVIVSRHFCSLGEFRLRHGEHLSDTGKDLIRTFLKGERWRQQRLEGSCGCSSRELDALLAVLQFCDLLSLYLCSGATCEAEFPQRLADRPVRISRHGKEHIYRLDPSPFQKGTGESILSVEVTARRYPATGGPALTSLGFLLV